MPKKKYIKILFIYLKMECKYKLIDLLQVLHLEQWKDLLLSHSMK